MNPRLEQLDREAKAGQQIRERAVELVAEASATTQRDPLGKCARIELDRNPELDVEVLERHPLEMGAVEGTQRSGRRRRPCVPAQTAEIGVNETGLDVFRLRRSRHRTILEALVLLGQAASLPRISAPKR